MKKIAIVGLMIMMAVGGALIDCKNEVFAAQIRDEAICSDSSISAADKKAAGCTVFTTNKLMGRVNRVLKIAIGMAMLLAVVFIIYGGYQFVVSRGDSGKVNAARNTILYGVVGLIVALLAYAIINFMVVNMLQEPVEAGPPAGASAV